MKYCIFINTLSVTMASQTLLSSEFHIICSFSFMFELTLRSFRTHSYSISIITDLNIELPFLLRNTRFVLIDLLAILRLESDYKLIRTGPFRHFVFYFRCEFILRFKTRYQLEFANFTSTLFESIHLITKIYLFPTSHSPQTKLPSRSQLLSPPYNLIHSLLILYSQICGFSTTIKEVSLRSLFLLLSSSLHLTCSSFY